MFYLSAYALWKYYNCDSKMIQLMPVNLANTVTLGLAEYQGGQPGGLRNPITIRKSILDIVIDVDLHCIENAAVIAEE